MSDHIANGMYGAILVDTARDLPNVDRESYVGQGDAYTSGDTNDPGQQDLDMAKLFDERPTYVMFNGGAQALSGGGALQAEVAKPTNSWSRRCQTAKGGTGDFALQSST